MRFHGRAAYANGIRDAARENAPAFGFSIMITSVFGVLATLDGTPGAGEVFLFAPGATLGFALTLLLARLGTSDEEMEVERTDVILLAALLNLGSVVAGLSAAALLALVLGGWLVWLVAPAAAGCVYVLVSGVEFTIAEEAEAGAGDG
jgi:hypothetical protein